MFGFFKKKKNKKEAAAVYGMLMEQIRQPIFYERWRVPDTFEGRFDLLLLHVFFVLQTLLNKTEDDEGGRETAEAFNQDLFDVLFTDMDQVLREAGVGDMGIPKHMRRMMVAFNGRMNAYAKVFTSCSEEHQHNIVEALTKNIYGETDRACAECVSCLKAYSMKQFCHLNQQSLPALLSGAFEFKEITCLEPEDEEPVSCKSV